MEWGTNWVAMIISKCNVFCFKRKYNVRTNLWDTLYFSLGWNSGSKRQNISWTHSQICLIAMLKNPDPDVLNSEVKYPWSIHPKWYISIEWYIFKIRKFLLKGKWTNHINTTTGEGLRITRPGGGHILPPLLSRLPEMLETRNLGGG